MSRGFTLFELLLAIALAAALLVLIGAAINLYLQRCDTDRLRVEEAQLARVVLDMIAADLRSAAVYEPQSMSGLSQMISTAASAADNSSEASGGDEGPGGGGSGGGGSGGSGDSEGGDGGSSQGASGGGGAAGNASGTGSASGSAAGTEQETPLGIHGDGTQLIVDVNQRPVFSSWLPNQSPTNVVSSFTAKLSDIRSVRWFVRAGEQIRASSLSITNLDPERQLRIGGLVRQEVDWTTRHVAEASGGAPLVDAPGRLIAPEIVRLQLRYFSGSEVLELWDIAEAEALPRAVEVSIWLRPADAEGVLGPLAVGGASMDPTTLRQYTMTVYLPLARPADNSATDSTSETSGSSGTEST